MPTQADHEIEIVLTDGMHAVPAIPGNLKVNETARYFTKRPPGKDVEVRFEDNGSPFIDANGNEITVITSTTPPLVLSKKSPPPPPVPDGPGFTCRCFIILETGERIGWDPLKSPQSGGNHVVK